MNDPDFASSAGPSGITEGRHLRVANPQEFLSRAVRKPHALSAFDAVTVRDGARGGTEDPKILGRMRRLLFDAGFLPTRCATSGALCYMRSALITDRELVSITAEDGISMTELGHRGRFGNQLFQYAFLKLYSLRNHLTLKLPEWQGEFQFDLADERSERDAYPDLSFDAFDDDDLVFWEQDCPPRNVNLAGFFQEIPACWIPHRAFLRRVFSLRPEWRAPIDREIDALRARGQTLVAIHVRRGDYREGPCPDAPWFERVPLAWYRAVLDQLWPTLKNPVLFVATDGGEEVRREFATYPSFDAVGSLPEMPDHIRDFSILRSADTLVLCNSSYSRMAALLGEDEQQCFLPSFADGRFHPYAPWEDRSFWSRFSSPEVAGGLWGSDLSTVRRRSVHYRQLLGQSRHRLPASLFRSAAPAPVPCKVCAADSFLFGVMDFNDWGGNHAPGTDHLSGLAVYYRRCESCGLIFITNFDKWSPHEFQRSLYNGDFIDRQWPSVLEYRTRAAQRVAEMVPHRHGLSILDCGASNDQTVEMFARAGFGTSKGLDLFNAIVPEFGGQSFDIVSCFDVLDRIPDPASDVQFLASCLGPRGVFVVTVSTKAGDAPDWHRASPHLGPRGGQVAAFSTKSLARFWSRLGFRIAPLGEDFYLVFRELPDFVRHLTAIEAIPV